MPRYKYEYVICMSLTIVSKWPMQPDAVPSPRCWASLHPAALSQPVPAIRMVCLTAGDLAPARGLIS